MDLFDYFALVFVYYSFTFSNVLLFPYYTFSLLLPSHTSHENR